MLSKNRKIIEDANKVAEKMKEDAQARIEQELKKASGQLRSEAVALVGANGGRNIEEKYHSTGSRSHGQGIYG
ncbi:MAG: hypothetical protein MZV70_51880 [Desulfobacterales bacterium]|nr:hypothetical protein [Desulfobacterales bacterium]